MPRCLCFILSCTSQSTWSQTSKLKDIKVLKRCLGSILEQGGYTLPDLRYTYPRKTHTVKHFLRSENVQTAISTLGQYVNGQTSRCASMGKVLFRCEFHISPSSAILLTNELTMLAILSTYPFRFLLSIFIVIKLSIYLHLSIQLSIYPGYCIY